MPFYHSLGKLPRKRHTVLRREDGGIHYEQLMGNKGFVGPSSLLYHLRPPTAVLRVEPVAVAERGPDLEPDPDRRLRHRHLRTGLAPAGGSPTQDRIPLLANLDLTIACARPDRDDPCFYRNGLADEYVFVHQGKGRLETQLGELDFGPGDQLVVPRGILQRYRIEEPARMLVVESRGYLRWPRRYRNEHGQLLEGAPFSERDIRRPLRLPAEDEQGEFEIRVKQAGGLTRIVLDHHPFDLVGWDGYYYPWAANIEETGEYVINVCSYAIAEQINRCSFEYPPEVDELELAGLSRLPSERVRPPRVAESPIHLECKLHQVLRHGTGPLSSAYVVGEILLVHAREEVLGPDGLPDERRVDLIARLGSDNYARIIPEAFFEMKRPTGP